MSLAPLPTPSSPFHEISLALTTDQALAEANRCLFCYDAPCIRACPTGIDIPVFIKKIATGNLVGAARTIFEANVLGGSCARVCPVEVLCEGSCVEKSLLKRPVQIGRLQRFATDYVLARGIDTLSAGAPTGKSVAVIGAGPSGLGAAAELRKLGHAVTLFDNRSHGGGLNTYGMAEYKQTAALGILEAGMVERLGAVFRQEVTVGKDLSAEELLRDFQLVFLGVGLGNTGKLGIPGDDLAHVHEALAWIEKLKAAPDKAERLDHKRVLVIGGGNTAIDAVTQSRLLGAQATLAYRRSEANMPAYRYEIELARSLGCAILFSHVPVRVLPHAMVFQTPHGEQEVPADLVLPAIGQKKRVDFLKSLPGVTLDERGRVQVDQGSRRTGNPKIFAGGDCVSGGSDAVNAVAEGRAAAKAMHAQLQRV